MTSNDIKTKHKIIDPGNKDCDSFKKLLGRKVRFLRTKHGMKQMELPKLLKNCPESNLTKLVFLKTSLYEDSFSISPILSP